MHRMLRLALLITIVALLGATAAIRRDYQDTWILEGLEIPFTVFMVTYVIYGFAEKNSKWIILFAIICRSIMVLLPNLKYPWFQGVWADSNAHYRLFQDVYDTGFVPVDRMYSGTPFLHVLSTVYSLTTGVSPLYTFKYMPILFWLIYPLAVYLIMRWAIPRNSSAIKYGVLISSIPIKYTTSYVVVGAMFGSLIVLLFLSQLTRRSQTSNPNHWIVAILYSFALVTAHSYSSIILVSGLLIAYLICNVKVSGFQGFKVSKELNIGVLMFVLVLSVAWIAQVAPRSFSSMTYALERFLDVIFGSALDGLPKTGIRLSIFELSTVNMIRTAVVYYGADIFALFLTLLGIIIVSKKFRSSKSIMFLSIYFVSVWIFYVIQLTLPGGRAGLVEYNRIFEHTLVLSPAFIGILLHFLGLKFRRIAPSLLIVLAFVALATVELYRCQPLIPTSSFDEPMIYIGNVNSAYQRYMIKHAEKHISSGVIYSDIVTRCQIEGLTDYYGFSQNDSIRFHLFSDASELSIVQGESDYFLIHLPGKSGVLMIRNAQIPLSSLIYETVHTSSIIYTNGESFILSKPFMNLTAP